MLAFVKKVKQTRAIEIIAMSNLRPSSTGIQGTVLWVSSGEFEGKTSQHGPRVKVMLGNRVTDAGLENAATVVLADPPRLLGELPVAIKKQTFEFVKRNLKVLLSYWNKEIDTAEMVAALQKLEGK